MSVIACKLNELWNVRQAIAAVDAEVKVVAGALLDERAKLETQDKALVAEAKSKAKFIPADARHTLVGDHLQMVYAVREAWSDEALSTLAARFGIPADDLTACKVGTEVWSVKVKK
jgi:hypothetical protein